MAQTLHAERRPGEPMHRQLTAQLRAAILDGRLAVGARLPSSRSLAADLGVSRATVVLALEQLQAEGYLVGRAGAGTFVAADLGSPVARGRTTARPRGAAAAVSEGVPANPRPFQLGAADSGLFPHRVWARQLYRSWREPRGELISGTDRFGLPELRAAIAQHLHAWRAFEANPEQIVVTAGTVDALGLLTGALGEAARCIYLEEPGYPIVRETLRGLGCTVLASPVDAEGFDIHRAQSLGPARVALVTPSRHYPLGATMPLRRRLELLEWAAASDGYVIEDDFDSEYRYEGSPLPALAALDRRARTIYIGSFSKVLAGTIRLGFAVLPEPLVPSVRRELDRRGTFASLVAQPAIARLIEEGEYAAHVRRTRRLYARRCAALLAEAGRLDGSLTLTPTRAGMHVLADLAPDLAASHGDVALAGKLADAGLTVTPLSIHYAGTPERNGFLLGFAGFSEPKLRAAVRRLADALARL